LRQKAEVSAALARVGQATTSCLEAREILGRLCQLTIELLQCEHSIVLWQAGEDVFVPIAGYVESREQCDRSGR